MADINIRKRKNSLNEIVVEISDDDITQLDQSSESADVEIIEPDAKVPRTDITSSQNSDSNLESLHSQSSLEIINDDPVKDLSQKVLTLQKELLQLKSENEELKSRTCQCTKAEALISSFNSEEVPIISVKFINEDIAEQYRAKFVGFLSAFVEFDITQNNTFTLDVFNDSAIKADEWIVIDKVDVETEESSPSKKKKHKKKSRKSDSELFMLDTAPSLSTKEDNVLKYESRFGIIDGSNKNGSLEVTKAAVISSCFNCGESHNLKDCPEPRNQSRINAARQKFKSQQIKSARYHLEDDQKYGHLSPGKITEKLRKALGLRKNEIPSHIYKMRQFGYPPGWIEEAEITKSDLTLFDFDGKGVESSVKLKLSIDPEKIVEYPGFNMPLEKGTKDEYKLHDCPPFSKDYSKEAMLEFIMRMEKKSQDDLAICDMEVDTTNSDKEIESLPLGCKLDTEQEKNKKSAGYISPSLLELESKKKELLAELNYAKSVIVTNETTANPVVVNENTKSNECRTDSSKDASNQDSFITTDKTTARENGLRDEVQESPVANGLNPVLTSAFGTPIIKGASPYSRLPKPENFSQNISQVINFENLPNSTGKYEQMTGVLQKVRRSLKLLNDSKS